MDKEKSSQHEIAKSIAENTPPAEREALKIWLNELLNIRKADIPAHTKAKKALSISTKNEVLVPLIKVISRELKRYLWDKQKKPMKFGIVGAGVGVALFGSASAGVAALGSAIGVPLWIVLGAGATFARMLYDELMGGGSPPSTPKTIYTVIDAEKDES